MSTLLSGESIYGVLLIAMNTSSTGPRSTEEDVPAVAKVIGWFCQRWQSLEYCSKDSTAIGGNNVR